MERSQMIPKPSAPRLSESQIILLNENSKPSAPRYESIINLDKLWRTSYLNLDVINTPPISDGNNKEASAPLIREESIVYLIQSQNNIEANHIELENQFNNSLFNLPIREVKRVQQPRRTSRRSSKNNRRGSRKNRRSSRKGSRRSRKSSRSK
jgi:hypothetical protein